MWRALREPVSVAPQSYALADCTKGPPVPMEKLYGTGKPASPGALSAIAYLAQLPPDIGVTCDNVGLTKCTSSVRKRTLSAHSEREQLRERHRAQHHRVLGTLRWGVTCNNVT